LKKHPAKSKWRRPKPSSGRTSGARYVRSRRTISAEIAHQSGEVRERLDELSAGLESLSSTQKEQLAALRADGIARKGQAEQTAAELKSGVEQLTGDLRSFASTQKEELAALVPMPSRAKDRRANRRRAKIRR